jgi:hypothetical protein
MRFRVNRFIFGVLESKKQKEQGLALNIMLDLLIKLFNHPPPFSIFTLVLAFKSFIDIFIFC